MHHIRFRSALLGLSMLAGSATVALSQTGTAGVPPRQGRGAHAGAGKGQAGLFKGMTLSAAEKSRLKAVHQKYAPELKAIRGTAKPDAQAVRDARQRGDTAALRALRQRSPEQRQQTQALMLKMQSDLRAALSPENQAKFDANVASLKNRSGRAAKAHPGRTASRGIGGRGGRVRPIRPPTDTI